MRIIVKKWAAISVIDHDGGFSVDEPRKPGNAGRFHVDATLAAALALLLDPPVGVVADAAGLADDQIGGGEGAIDAMQAFLQTAVVVQEAPAALLDHLPVGIDRTGAAADAEDAFTGDIHRSVAVDV